MESTNPSYQSTQPHSTTRSSSSSIPVASLVPLSHLNHNFQIKLIHDNHLHGVPNCFKDTLYGNVDGTTPCPSKVIASTTDDASSSNLVENPAYTRGMVSSRQNSFSMFWFPHFLNPFLLVVNLDTSRAVWLTFEKMFPLNQKLKLCTQDINWLL